MTSTEGDTTLATLERLISTQMVTALEMIADVLDVPGMDLDRYDRFATIAESAGPTFVLALIRAGAGVAAAGGLTGGDLRAFSKL